MKFQNKVERVVRLAKPTEPGGGLDVLLLFHHIHHEDGEHKVHHCGGDHPGATYTVDHCPCDKHWIDKQEAVGHGVTGEELKIKFLKRCPKMRKKKVWHIESGVLPSQQIVEEDGKG